MREVKARKAAGKGKSQEELQQNLIDEIQQKVAGDEKRTRTGRHGTQKIEADLVADGYIDDFLNRTFLRRPQRFACSPPLTCKSEPPATLPEVCTGPSPSMEVQGKWNCKGDSRRDW